MSPFTTRTVSRRANKFYYPIPAEREPLAGPLPFCVCTKEELEEEEEEERSGTEEVTYKD